MSLLDPGDRPGWLVAPRIIYALRAVGSGRIKVGQTRNPHRRFPCHVTDCPFPVEPVMLTWAEASFEWTLHERLSAHHLHLEWFADNAQTAEIIRFAHSDPSRLLHRDDVVADRASGEIKRRLRAVQREDVSRWVDKRIAMLAAQHGWTP